MLIVDHSMILYQLECSVSWNLMRFVVSTVVNINIKVFLVATPCTSSLVHRKLFTLCYIPKECNLEIRLLWEPIDTRDHGNFEVLPILALKCSVSMRGFCEYCDKPASKFHKRKNLKAI
jgi:hypothetical protein